MLRDLFGPLADETSTWQGFKIWLTGYIPLDRDLMHVALGAAVLIGFLFAFRSRRAIGIAVVCSLGLGIVMEVLDRRDDLALGGDWRWGESLSDIGLTVLVPVLAFLLAGRRGGGSTSSGP